MAVEAIGAIGAAMADADVVGVGRLTLSRRERTIVVEPRGTGMVLITLHAFEEVRSPQFIKADADSPIHTEMLAIARAIIEQLIGKFDPSKFKDRYQEALEELIEAKMKGIVVKPREVSTPAPVIDLVAALKRSLSQAAPQVTRPSIKTRARTKPDRRQRALFLPVSSGSRQKEPVVRPSTVVAKRRRKA